MRKIIFIALALAVLTAVQFFVPIKQESGAILKTVDGDGITCEQKTSSQRYSLLLGGLNKYEEMSKAFSDLRTDELCGTERITISLFII